KEELIFLGREISEQRDYSEAIAQKIDNEVRHVVNEAYKKACEIMSTYREKLDAVAQKLLEVETLSRDDFEKLFPPPLEKNGGTPVMQATV
ncbi:MAG: cell division protein FtsH, partial [Anaerolineae bacterium]|nr:cell division protein FtsH [Anaerolineae bacterium]